MGNLLRFPKNPAQAKAKPCVHKNVAFATNTARLICKDCNAVVEANQWLSKHFAQLEKWHKDLNARENNLNERAGVMLVQERKLTKMRKTEPCIHCGRTQTLPVPKVVAQERIEAIKEMLKGGERDGYPLYQP